MTDFVRRLLALRARHPIFRRASYRDGTIVRWINPAGTDMTPEQWDEPAAVTIGLLLRLSDDGREIDEALILWNAYHGDVPFHLPPREGGRVWTRVLSTDEVDDARDARMDGTLMLTGRSIRVLAVSRTRQLPVDARRQDDRAHRAVDAFDGADPVEQKVQLLDRRRLDDDDHVVGARDRMQGPDLGYGGQLRQPTSARASARP